MPSLDVKYKRLSVTSVQRRRVARQKVQVLETEILGGASLDVVRATLIVVCNLTAHVLVNLNEKTPSLPDSGRVEVTSVAGQIKCEHALHRRGDRSDVFKTSPNTTRV